MLLSDFVIRAIIGGVGIAVIAGVLGCFIVWRRMAYFGDSLSHSGLLGVAIGVSAGLGVSVGALIACSMFAVLLVYLERTKLLSTDTLLGILAHLALSLGVISLSILEQQSQLHAYLFGDILTITQFDIYRIYLGVLVVLILVRINWSGLVLITLHQDLAASEHIAIMRKQLLLMLLLATVVGLSVNIIGLLLTSAMLIIPAASARQLAHTPEQMVVISALLGVLAMIVGLGGSVLLNTPSGPSVVVCAAIIFAALMSYRVFKSGIS